MTNNDLALLHRATTHLITRAHGAEDLSCDGMFNPPIRTCCEVHEVHDRLIGLDVFLSRIPDCPRCGRKAEEVTDELNVDDQYVVLTDTWECFFCGIEWGTYARD